jgi:hypothetical protein
LQEEALNSPIEADFKQQFQEMLEKMSRSLQQVDAAAYCPVLIQRMQHFDQQAFQKSVEMKYKKILNQAEALKKAAKPQ